ncbi:hypothetical protein [Synechococcus lacustris]|uniref:hypothetical protein n=1 Tax=Synechococcus lacustris TaxID=2116544 RepID=UPI0020CC6ADA|nr:hypothetical protein [Synechococcus lacustris]MCP9794873.1 hypothetical protein [Synechococcus lacustris L1F-Slac]MCP9813428.1 hypothetical protein [Synechococcus lacustris L1E-Slac]
MAPHLLSFSARARQEQEALKVALANGDGASLKSISERLVHRQGPGALQLLMRKLASNAEALAFWQQQLLPIDILALETIPIETRLVENMPVQQISAEYCEEVKEVIEVEEVVESCPPEPIAEKKIEVARRLRGWLPSWNGPLRQAS